MVATLIASETFTDTDGTLLSAHTNAGGTWTKATNAFGTGDMVIGSNAASRNSSTAACLLLQGPSYGSSVDLTLDLTRTNATVGSNTVKLYAFANGTSANRNGYVLQFSGTNSWTITSFNNGVGTDYVGDFSTINVGQTVKVRFHVEVGRQEVWVDNVLIGFANDSTVTPSPYCGLGSTGVAPLVPPDYTVDNWQAWANYAPPAATTRITRKSSASSARPGVLVSTYGTYNSLRIPALGLTTNYLHAFFEGRYVSSADTTASDIVLYRIPRGTTWYTAIGALQVVCNEGTAGGGGAGGPKAQNPCVVTRADGSLLLVYVRYPAGSNENSNVLGTTGATATVWYRTSTGEGATWSAAAEITSSIKDGTVGACFTGPGRGLLHSSGRILIPFQQQFGANGSGRDDAYAAYSDDAGATWTKGAAITSAGNGFQVSENVFVELPNGDVLADMRPTGGGGSPQVRLLAISTDRGATFGTPFRATGGSGLLDPVCAAGCCTAPGGVIVHTHPNSSSTRVTGTHQTARDRGTTWSDPATPATSWPGGGLMEVVDGGFEYSSCVYADGYIYTIYESGASYEHMSLNRATLAWAGAAATSYTLTGPSSGTVTAASTNFTVAPVGGAATAAVTPHSTGTGTFSPTGLTFSASASAQTFSYTPTSTTGSPHTITTTASPSLGSDPAGVAYTVNAAASTSGVWLASVRPDAVYPVAVWPEAVRARVR